MAKTLLIAVPVLLLACVPRAAAQQPDGLAHETRTAGSIDFGGRFFDVSGDSARDQRYRDLRSGPTVDRFRYARDESSWVFTAAADHAGYRDQRYSAQFARPGKVKASFEWDQIPLFYSTVTASPYVQTEPGVFRLDDNLQLAVQNGTATISSFVPLASTFELRSRRETAAFHLTVTPSRALDVKLDVTSTARAGAQPWGVGWGFSNVSEVAAPLDNRTTEIGTAVEWANDRGMARVGYDGSWFHNEIETLVVDNPVRATDTTSAVSTSRTALWPSSEANAVNVAGSIKFPARGRATAYISVGNWTQNAALIPFTINTAIAPIPLDRPTAEAEARVTAMNYTANASPARNVWLNARFKRYDFDNRTPLFHFTSYVRTDQSVVASSIGTNEPLGYVRDNFDADASFTPLPFTAFRIGYGREAVTRTHRYVETTAENAIRGTVDFTGHSLVTLRLVYEHAKRTGTGLDEEALDQVGEQLSLRQFDISDRDRDRVSAIVQVTPVPQLGITASIAGGTDRRPDAEFGLNHYDNRTYAVSIDAVPRDGTTFGASYGFEDYNTTQDSRQASPGVQFEDPTRNWSTLGAERVHTANVSADLLKLAPNTELHVSYDFSRSRGRYTYVVPADSTLAPISQLPALLNELHHGAVALTYRVRRDVNAGVEYWYDRYRVEDFALDAGALNRLDMTTGVLLLANSYRPYRSSTVMLRVTYLW